MILFLVQYLRPDIANAVWELSKVNNKANCVHYKQIKSSQVGSIYKKQNVKIYSRKE